MGLHPLNFLVTQLFTRCCTTNCLECTVIIGLNVCLYAYVIKKLLVRDMCLDCVTLRTLFISTPFRISSPQNAKVVGEIMTGIRISSPHNAKVVDEIVTGISTANPKWSEDLIHSKHTSFLLPAYMYMYI